jgi:hypothetical protein
MRRRMTMTGLLLTAVLATGCKDHYFQVSVHPFLSTTGAPGDLGGRWVGEGDESTGLVFVPAEEGEWRLDVFDPRAGEEKPAQAALGVLHFGRVGGTLYWDMTAPPVASADELAREHILDLHSVARVRLDGETMEIAFLKPEWMSEALADGRVDLAHFREDEDDREGSVILTAATAALEAFLEAHGEDPDAFGEPEVFHRVS